MKILIVDDYPETKCWGIIEELKKRKIEYEIVKAINPALRKIVLDEIDIDGIILDMGLPIYEEKTMLEKNGGDRILRELKRRKINIPVLIFSETQSEFKSKCEFVFDQMTNWNIVQEENKYSAFLEKIQNTK